MYNLLEEPATTGNSWTMWLILGVFAVVIIAYFVWSTRSAKKRQDQTMQMLKSIKPGDKVKTIGGVCGEVVSVNDEENTITIATGEGQFTSYVKFDRNAIYQTNAQLDAEAAKKAEDAKKEDEEVKEEKTKEDKKEEAAKEDKKAEKDAE